MTTKRDKIYAESVEGVDLDLVEEAKELSNETYGYTPKVEELEDELEAFVGATIATKEIADDVKNFMRKFGIGQDLSSDKWSQHAKDKVLGSIKDMFNAVTDEPNASFGQLFTNLKKSVMGKKYDQSDVSVVARTETAKMRAVMQLKKFKEAGLEKVKYQTQEDSKVRPSHQDLNGEVFEIDYLLANDEARIPRDPNCRCRYQPYMGDIDV